MMEMYNWVFTCLAVVEKGRTEQEGKPKPNFKLLRHLDKLEIEVGKLSEGTDVRLPKSTEGRMSDMEDKTVTENMMASCRFNFLKSYNCYQRKLAKWIQTYNTITGIMVPRENAPYLRLSEIPSKSK